MLKRLIFVLPKTQVVKALIMPAEEDVTVSLHFSLCQGDIGIFYSQIISGGETNE